MWSKSRIYIMKLGLESLIEAVSWKPDFTENYKDYYTKIKDANLITLGTIRELLNPSNNTICTVGSDARLENGYGSKIEITILLNENNENSQRENYFKQVKKFDPMFHPIIEFKEINDKSYLYQNDSSKVFPTRVLDLRYILGDYNRFVKEKDKFIKELEQDCTAIKRNLRKRRAYYLKILATGSAKFKNFNVTHYNLTTGEVFFDNNFRWGLKYGPLRAVQYDVAYNVIKLVKESKDLEFLLQLPSGIVDRLRYLEKNPYATSEIEEIADNYMFFLKEYHICQKNFKEKLNKTKNALIRVLHNKSHLLNINRSSRAVQYDITHRVITILKNREIEFLLKIPHSIMERLDSSEKRPCPINEIEETLNDYLFSLKEHDVYQKSFSENVYKTENPTLITHYDSNQLLEIKERIKSLSSLLKR